MKKILLILCFLSVSTSFGQQFTLPNSLCTKFIDVSKSKNTDIVLTTTVDKNQLYETALTYKDSTVTFKLKPLTFPNFETKLKQAIIEVIKLNGVLKPEDSLPKSELVRNDIALVFSQIVTYQNSEEERPQVARILLKDKIKVYVKKKIKEDKIDKNGKKETIEKEIEEEISVLEDPNVEISFFGGFIEKIQVIGEIGSNKIAFNNKYSIGISSNKNIKQLAENSLFSNEYFTEKEINSFKNKKILNALLSNFGLIEKTNENFNKIFNPVIAHVSEAGGFSPTDSLIRVSQVKNLTGIAQAKFTSGKQQEFEKSINNLYEYINNDSQYNGGVKKTNVYIKADEVISYFKKVDVNANDISPVPQLVILDKNQKEAKLYREESSKLFEAVVYTDFLGVFDEENPNGIIQTEVSKQFNISSSRSDLWPKLFEAYGWFNYFNAHFQFSKIEKNNKFLLPSVYNGIDDTNTPFTESYYNPISLYQYRNFSIGGDLNILYLENQSAKINTTLNAGFLFGRSGIKEEVDQEVGNFLNNLEIPVEVKFNILPEKRFSFYMSDRLSWFEVFDSGINLKSIENNILVSKNRFLNTFNVGMNLDISSSGKLFLRYKLIHELDNINTNFSQLQFGYSFYLLQKNGMKKNE